MNKLSTEEKVSVVACLVEGNSLRATVRMTGIHRTTIQNLLVELGHACSVYQDKVLRNLNCKRIQCDEIWSFVGAKEKNATLEMKSEGWGDIWTWVAMDAQTKLVPCWFVGNRDGGAAYHFMLDVAERLASRVQLTTDGHKAYLNACGARFRLRNRLGATGEDLRQYARGWRGSLQPGCVHGNANRSHQWPARL